MSYGDYPRSERARRMAAKVKWLRQRGDQVVPVNVNALIGAQVPSRLDATWPRRTKETR